MRRAPWDLARLPEVPLPPGSSRSSLLSRVCVAPVVPGGWSAIGPRQNDLD